jgi:hypothetical protein
MGKIFGISNLPVSTIESALRIQNSVPKPMVKDLAASRKAAAKFIPVANPKKAEKSSLSLKLYNNIERIMSRFSKTKKG